MRQLPFAAQLLFLLALCATTAFSVAAAWRIARARTPGAAGSPLVGRGGRRTPILLVLLAIATWAGAYAVELLARDAAWTLWMGRIAYVGIALTPPLALLTTLEATRREGAARGTRSLLFLIPATTIGLAFTNDWQGLVWTAGPLQHMGLLSFSGRAHGPWFWVHVAFSYLCVAAAFTLVVRRYVHTWPSHSGEALAVAAAFALPWSANVFALWRGSALDFTPVAFGATAATLYVLVERASLLRLLPVARRQVLEALGDAVLVVDDENRVLDANRAGRGLLEQTPGGDGRSEAGAAPLDLARILSDPRRGNGDLCVRTERGVSRFYEVRADPVASSGAAGALRAVVIRDVTERRRAEQGLFRATHFDGLTGLENRRMFMRKLAASISDAKASGRMLALLDVGLDRFKEINESFGHAVGDQVLRAAASRLQRQPREGGISRAAGEPGSPIHLARTAGDEFGVVLSGIASPEQAGEAARRLLQALAEPIPIAGQRIAVRASVGIAVWPLDGHDEEILSKHADTALHHARQCGGGSFQYFRPELNASAERRMAVELRLRQAIHEDRLELHYQPKIEISTRAVTGVEALLRWNDPRLGRVSPAEAVPVAESTGLAGPLGVWVIDAVCARLRHWKGMGRRPVRVALNVSSRQFEHGDLREVVAEATRRHGVEPRFIEIEITESVPLQDRGETARVLRDLRSMGVRVVLDDFGTGYSALSYLPAFPLDALKLDRSFVRDLASDRAAAGVAAAVISMAHSLGLEVVAEGVETDEQLEILQQMSCDQAQGYLISPPVPAEELDIFLAAAADDPVQRS